MLHNELAALCFPSTWLPRDDAALWSSFSQHVMIDLTGHSKYVWRKGSRVFMWSWVLVGDLCVYRGEEIISWCLLKLYFVYSKENCWDISYMCRKGGTGGGGWVSPKGRQHVAIIVVGCRKAYISTRLAISLPFAQMSLYYKLFCRGWHWGSFDLDGDSLVESLTIESLIMSGCGFEVCTKLLRVCLN